MDVSLIRTTILGSLGLAVGSAALAGEPATIPEVAAEPSTTTIPEVTDVAATPEADEVAALARQRIQALEAELGLADRADAKARREQLEALIPKLPTLLGDPLPGVHYLGNRGPDLGTLEGRVDAVLRCSAPPYGEVSPCDFSGLLSPERAVKKANGVREASGAVMLDAELRYRNLVSRCEAPVSIVDCGWGLRVDARTGVCEEPRKCRKGRAFAGGRVAELSGAPRDVAGAAWTEVALDEHASIASFARHQLELLAHGAPLELVEAVALAQLDEARHTQLALEIARSFGAEPVIGPLDTGFEPRASLEDVLVAVAEEGCLGETLAAVECAVAAQRAHSPAVQRALEQIAADEAEHAALAWRTLQWGLPRLEPSARRRVLAVFVDAQPGFGPEVPEGIGILPGEQARVVRRWALEQVVEPALVAVA